jgi:hypothetical protein
MTVVGMAFIPVFIAAWVVLRSGWRALVLAVMFTAGALAGFVGGGLVGYSLMTTDSAGPPSFISALLFSTAGAVAGGVLAVWLLGRFSKYPPWKRY